MKKLLLATTFLTCMTSGLAAQSLPSMLEGKPLEFLAEVAGLDVLKDTMTGEIWMVAPDGATVIKGDIFTATGGNLGAFLAGNTAPQVPAPPLAQVAEAQTTVQTTVQPTVPPPLSAAPVSEPFAVPSDLIEMPQVAMPVIAAPTAPPTPLPGNTPQLTSPTVAATSPTPPAPVQDVPGQVVQATPADGDAPGDQNWQFIGTPFRDHPPEVQAYIRAELLDMLFERLNATTSPEEAAQSLQEWADMVDSIAAQGGDPSAPTSRDLLSDTGFEVPSAGSDIGDQSANTVAPSIAPAAIVAPQAAPPAAMITPENQSMAGDLPPIVAAPIGNAPAAAAPSSTQAAMPPAQAQKPTAAELLATVQTKTFWFPVGPQDGPVVYAFIDPTCPYCARAMRQMKEVVESGQVGLRVILTPVLSERAQAVTAGILLSEDPAAAYWRHELSLADFGNSDIQPRNPVDLSAQYQEAIRQNVTVFGAAGLAGVPSFVFMRDTGAVVMEGTPPNSVLLTAKPDPR